MGGLLGGVNVPYQPDATTVAEQIAKLRGRSQAANLLRQLNQPYVPFTADVMASMEELGKNRFSPSRELVPAPGNSIVPYEAGGGALARIPTPEAPLARTLQNGIGRLPNPPGAARYGLPELMPGVGGGVGGGGVPPGGAYRMAAGAAGEGAGGPIGGAVRMLGPGAAALEESVPAATGLARFMPGLFNAGKLAPLQAAKGAAPWVIGGMVADPLIRGIIPGHSNAENVLGNTAKYAGIGAGIGSIFPGAGTLIGGLAGGTFGAVSTLWHKDKGPTDQKQRNKLLEQLGTANLPDDVKNNISQQYKVLYSLAKTPEEKQAAFDSAKELLISSIQENAQSGQDADTMLASQAMLQQFLAPTTRGIVSSAQNQSNYLNQIAGSLPPELRTPALVGAHQRVADANRIAGAYAQQMGSIPQLAALQLQSQRENQAASRAYSQALTSSMSGGGAGDIQALLAGG